MQCVGNWQRGSFSYSWSNASKSLYNLKATGTAGHSIFWRTEKDEVCYNSNHTYYLFNSKSER